MSAKSRGRAPVKLITMFSFDATYLYQYTFILLYNLVFTSLPVIVLGGTSLGFYCGSTILIMTHISSQHSTRISTQKQHSPSHNYTCVASADLSIPEPSFGCTWEMVSISHVWCSSFLLRCGQSTCLFPGMEGGLIL